MYLRLVPNSASEDPQAVLSWALEAHRGRLALSCSFGGPTGMALLDMALRLEPGLPVFCIDTGFLFPETYALIERAEAHYGIQVQRVHPAVDPETQTKVYGPALWSRDPHLCCGLRKVEPQRAYLQRFDAWITGLRRDQSPTRRDTPAVGFDPALQIVKIAPLAAWTEAQVWDYVRARGVPHNPLHDRGYPSIGCTHCTRAVAAHEDPRAGRWSGFDKTECGLHYQTGGLRT